MARTDIANYLRLARKGSAVCSSASNNDGLLSFDRRELESRIRPATSKHWQRDPSPSSRGLLAQPFRT